MADQTANDGAAYRRIPARQPVQDSGPTGWRQSLANWLHTVPGTPIAPGRPSLVVLAWIATVVWLAALGAYAVGFYNRMAAAPEDAGTTSLLPTLDLLFFAFAVAGPLAMLWIVVVALGRADRFSNALTAQGDSALALAATIVNLNDSVEQLGAGIEARLEGLPARVDKIMLDSAVVIDERAEQRSQHLADMLEKGVSDLDVRLQADGQRLIEAVGLEREALATLRDGLDKRIAQVTAETAGRLEAGLAETRGRIDKDLAQAIYRQTSGLADGDTLVRDTLQRLTADLEGRLGSQAEQLEKLQAQLSKTADFVSANPPASPEDLASLLGDAASSQVAPERKALLTALDRIERLENKAEELLNTIDRTSRLNPLMESADTTLTPVADPVDDTAALPFQYLPAQGKRGDLNWTAVVRALEGSTPSRGTRQALTRAASDPDVARVLDLTRRVANGLADDRVFIADLKPEPSSAATWAAFSRGERTADTAALGTSVQDDVALALTRARLRNDADFHALSLRLIAAYGDLIGRAASEIGADPRLVEMSDTPPGRTVQLLLSVLRPFGSGD